MTGNVDSVRFKFSCNVHDWAYFEKNIRFRKHVFLHKIAHGLGQDIFVSNFM